MVKQKFEWDRNKNETNIEKHGVSFNEAQNAFFDPERVIFENKSHSTEEERFFCFGKVNNDVLTVSFTYRDDKIRIIGAGYWRKGKKIYEQENS